MTATDALRARASIIIRGRDFTQVDPPRRYKADCGRMPLTLTQTEAAPEGVEQIWQGMFDGLANVLQG